MKLLRNLILLCITSASIANTMPGECGSGLTDYCYVSDTYEQRACSNSNANNINTSNSDSEKCDLNKENFRIKHEKNLPATKIILLNVLKRPLFTNASHLLYLQHYMPATDNYFQDFIDDDPSEAISIFNSTSDNDLALAVAHPKYLQTLLTILEKDDFICIGYTSAELIDASMRKIHCVAAKKINMCIQLALELDHLRETYIESMPLNVYFGRQIPKCSRDPLIQIKEFVRMNYRYGTGGHGMIANLDSGSGYNLNITSKTPW